MIKKTLMKELFIEVWIGSKELTRDAEVVEASNHGKLLALDGPGEKIVYSSPVRD